MIVKHPLAQHIGFVYDSYKTHGSNPYDTVYSLAKKLGASERIEEEYKDSKGFSYPTIKFKFDDGSSSRMSKDGYQILSLS